MRVAVAGGTGVVGAHTVQALARNGHEPVVLSRSRGVDVTTGSGLDQALTGVGAVVDVTNVSAFTRRASVAFFDDGTRHLLDAGERAGVRHHVALSIVGVDRVDSGYYAGKRRQEELVRSGPLPWTVLRATQFHEFAGQLLARVRGPLGLVPRMRVQPVAAAEVGARLAALATAPPGGLAPELAGPEVHELVDLARRVAARTGRRRWVVAVRVPGSAGRAMAAGALLPTGAAVPDGEAPTTSGPVTLGTVTFDEWLAAADLS
jgi:uncharacterized protein YbjT (DUF2867 family)